VVVFYFGDERCYGFTIETSLDGSSGTWLLTTVTNKTPYIVPGSPAVSFRQAATFAFDLTSNSAQHGPALGRGDGVRLGFMAGLLFINASDWVSLSPRVVFCIDYRWERPRPPQYRIDDSVDWVQPPC